MKGIKSIITIFAVTALFALVITGCNNLFDNGNTIEENAPYIKISLEDSSRTVNPTVNSSSLSNFTLKGTKLNENEVVYFENKSYSEITAADFTLKLAATGTYSFTLTAKINEMNYSGTIASKEIVAGANTLNFELELISIGEIVQGNGSLNFSLKIEDTTGIKKVKAVLIKYGTQEPFGNIVTYDVTGSAPLEFKKEDIPAGVYELNYAFYGDDDCQVTGGVYCEIVNISKDLESKGEATIKELKNLYTVNYELYGGTPENTTLRKTFSVKQSNYQLPDEERMHCSNRKFLGWYLTADYSGTAVTEVSPELAGCTLYAKWAVSSEGLGDYFTYLSENTKETPYEILLIKDNLDFSTIKGALSNTENKNKYVSLNFSECDFTTIGNNALFKCNNLTSIVLPLGVTTIEYDAFAQSENLTSIVLPQGLETIGKSAFQCCYSLESINLPEGIKKIEDYAFSECKKLKSVTLPDSLEYLGFNAFLNATSLTTLVVPENVVAQNGFLGGCVSLENLTIKNIQTLLSEIQEIPARFLFNCKKITSITIPSNATKINEDAFNGCESLISITIPETVTDIDSSAFLKCTGLKTLTIPGKFIENINKLFPDSRNLETITVSDSAAYELKDGKYFVQGNTLYKAFNLTGEVVLPDYITGIEEGAFKGLTELTKITIKASLLNNSHNLFPGCIKLNSIVLLDDDGNLVNDSNNKFSNHLLTIGGIIVSVTGDITSLTIDNTMEINSDALTDCSTLKELNLNCIKAISLAGCTGIKTLKVKTIKPEEGSEPVVLNMIKNCSSNSFALTITDDTEIEENAFYGCTKLTSVELPKVTSIGNYAFYGCNKLTSIKLPLTLTTVGNYAFADYYNENDLDVYYEGTIDDWKNISGINNAFFQTYPIIIYSEQ